MDFRSIIDRALEIRTLYEEKEKQQSGSSWSPQEITWVLLAMLVTWQNWFWQKTAGARSKTAERNWNTSSLIVYGQ